MKPGELVAIIARPHVRIRSIYRKPRRLFHVRAATQAALSVTGPLLRDTEWSISLTDDAELHRLNLQFRAMDKPTDVLSFGSERYRDGRLKPEFQAAFVQDDAPEYLGDIVISMERCTEQAEASGHDTESELALLVVHGTLHLLGYDHDTKARKGRMWSAQARALQTIGITLNVP